MIHVCFGLYDKTGRYSKFTGTTIVSLFENCNTPPPSTTVHILHDNTLTQDNRDKFNQVAGRYGQLVKFYNVEKLCEDKLNTYVKLVPFIKNAEVTVGAFFRFCATEVLPPEIDKVIYLDSDIIVKLDLTELWRIEIGDKPLAAVPAVNQKSDVNFMKRNFPLIGGGIVDIDDYFNSGVLLMNLAVLRNEEAAIVDGLKFRGKHPEWTMFDQEVLNYCFATRYVKLPVKFNRATRWARANEEPLSNQIYHYVGQNPVWSFSLDVSDRFNRLWMDYFVKTPWFDAATIDHLYESIRQIDIDAKQAFVQISAMMSGKTRAFVILPQNLDATKQIFAVRDDEEIISIGNENVVPKILDAMQRGRGKKIFFVLLPGFPFAALTNAGFVYGRDFFNGLEFLSEANGMPPINSHLLLKAL